jgi:hypothetical protein
MGTKQSQERSQVPLHAAPVDNPSTRPLYLFLTSPQYEHFANLTIDFSLNSHVTSYTDVEQINKNIQNLQYH